MSASTRSEAAGRRWIPEEKCCFPTKQRARAGKNASPAQNTRSIVMAHRFGVMVNISPASRNGNVNTKEHTKLLRRNTAQESAPATGTMQAPTNMVQHLCRSKSVISSTRKVGNSNGEFSV